MKEDFDFKRGVTVKQEGETDDKTQKGGHCRIQLISVY